MNSIHNICYTCDTNHILKSTCLNQVIVCLRLSDFFSVEFSMIPIPECSSRMVSFIMKLVYGLEEVSFLLDRN